MSDESSRALPEEGWYSDPAGGSGLRYWDGTQWTRHRRERSPATPPAQPAGPAPASPATPQAQPSAEPTWAAPQETQPPAKPPQPPPQAPASQQPPQPVATPVAPPAQPPQQAATPPATTPTPTAPTGVSKPGGLPFQWQWLIAIPVAVVLVLYFLGKFDPVLAHVGLNFNDCAEVTSTGDIVCNDELKRECENPAFRRSIPDVCENASAQVRYA